MIRALTRIVIGFVAACLTAALVTVLFVITPAQIAATAPDAMQDSLLTAGRLVLSVATHTAIFAAMTLSAPVAIALAEWLHIRSPWFYTFAAMTMSVAGFGAQYASETVNQPTIFNAFALASYLASGFFGGLMYWALSGRSAGSWPALFGAAKDDADDGVTFDRSAALEAAQIVTRQRRLGRLKGMNRLVIRRKTA